MPLNFKTIKMKKTFTLLFAVILSSAGIQFCAAQSPAKKFSIAAMPAFVQELQQGPPPVELMQNDPALYRRLLKRRTVLTGILQKAVADKQLPKEALEALNTNITPPNPANTSKKESITAAANFQFVKDINTSKDASPYNFNFNYTPAFAVLNKVVYYTADDGIHGSELWRSDGTEEGTYLVKDINPGSASGNAYYIIVFKSKLYFMAYAPETGYELYRSDGTDAGTILLKDIVPGSGSSQPYHFTAMNNSLHFTTIGAYNVSQLWKTDGTAAGTVMVTDIYSAYSASGIGQLINANNVLFFTAYNYAYGRELWRSDGTAGGTYMLKDINIANNNNYSDWNGPANLTAYNSKLYFSANDGYNRMLWQSDGTTAGTTVAPYGNGIILTSNNYGVYQDQPFAIAKNSLFFSGYYYTTGTELYKYNPANTAGIVLVKDIATADVSLGIITENIRSMNDTVYFLVPDFTGTTYELWKSAGTAANTKLVKALPGYANSYSMNVAGNNLYFTTASPEYGYEPWISNGSTAGTKLLKDVNTGAAGSGPGIYTLCNNKVYFSAYAASSGTELWITNGTTGGTKLVKNINTAATASGVPFSNYQNRFATVLSNDKIVFNAYTRTTGYELWKSNGTAAGTTLVKDIIPGENSGYPELYASKNGKAYFMASDSTGECIYMTDGTSAGTKKLGNTSSYIYDIKVADNGTVFYSVYNNSYELWRTDSSGTNFRLRTNIGSVSIGVAGNLCYFTAPSNYGYELWKSNGTLSGTNLLADIFPGSGSSSPGNFIAFNNKILFTAYNGVASYLCMSNGTTTGTKLLTSSISPNFNAGTAMLNGKLYFNAYESTLGYELYSTDGTAEGTGLVKDIYAGSSNSYPQQLTLVGNTIYFQAADATNYNALWKTNGTAAGTKLVKTSPNADGNFYIGNLTSAAGKLYFTFNQALWSSDGTTAGTTTVSDGGLSGITNIIYLLGMGNKLFINGYNYAYGYELYEGDASASVAEFASKAVTKTINTSGLTAQIIANPFVNDLKININSPRNQQVTVTVNNYAGQQLISKTITLNAGTNFISFNGSNWTQGMYVINLYSDTGSISLKAIK